MRTLKERGPPVTRKGIGRRRWRGWYIVRALHNANGEETHACKAIPARSGMYCVRVFVWHTRRPCKISYETRTALVRAVVVARHRSDDPVERGDDEDDAGRCRSDARARTRAALAAAERLRVKVATRPVPTSRKAAGGGFPNRPFLSLAKMKVARSTRSLGGR